MSMKPMFLIGFKYLKVNNSMFSKERDLSKEEKIRLLLQIEKWLHTENSFDGTLQFRNIVWFAKYLGYEKQDLEFLNNIYHKIIEGNFILFNRKTNLLLFEKLFAGKIFTSLLREYMKINDEISELLDNNIRQNAKEESISIFKLIPSQLILNEFLNYKDFRTEIIKGIELMKLIESNPKWEGLLTEFCKQNDIKNWRQYFKEILNLYNHLVNYANSGATIIELDSYLEVFERLSFKDQDFIKTADHIFLRTKPFRKVGNNSYQLISWDFLISKFYESLRFDLSSIVENTEQSDFKEFLSKEFFEDICGNYLHKCFSDEVQNGQLKQYIGSVEVDFALLGKDLIIVGEIKDYLVTKEFRTGKSYEEFWKYIEERFYLKPGKKTKRKGISQIVGKIDEILNENSSQVRANKCYGLVIYNEQYDFKGSNLIIYNLLRSEDVIPINFRFAAISIDKLILYTDFFSQNPGKLLKYIDDFNRIHLQGGDFKNLNKLINFGQFISESLDALEFKPSNNENILKLIYDELGLG